MDRNQEKSVAQKAFDASLSARRAWIEIVEEVQTDEEQTVALRKESVDRNLGCNDFLKLFKRSLSARRAWIEIAYGALDGASEIVALRKESVDRNVSLSPC